MRRLLALAAPLLAAPLVLASPGVAAESVTVPASRTVTVVGHGFGHGIGMSQYGAYGAAIAGLKPEQILAHYYPGTQIGTTTKKIRVLIGADTTKSVIVKARTGLRVYDFTTKKYRALPKSVGGVAVTFWRIMPRASNRQHSVLQYRTTKKKSWTTYAKTVFKGNAQFQGPGGNSILDLVLPDGSTVRYRGSLRSSKPTKTSTTRRTVNVITLERYVRGVVAREMPTSWKAEALQAQAIAARTYGARAIRTGVYYDICDTTSCQVYGGVRDEDPRSDAAVAATVGKIVTYKGAPAFTQFSSSSGGFTAKGSQPYLTAKADPYDSTPSNKRHSWTLTVKASTIEAAYPALGTLTSLAVVSRSGGGEWGGRVVSLKLTGSSGSTTISGDKARFALGLYSTWFAFA